MANEWEEVTTAALEKRHELTLHGSDISGRIDKCGLDERIFDLVSLNYLDISKTSLNRLGDGLGKLSNLNNLVLHNNQLTCVPACINNLDKLKLVDFSNNAITGFPNDVSNLSNLQSLNVSMNLLEEFPCVEPLVNLRVLNLSHNKLGHFPEGLFSSDLVHLSQVILNDNQISEVPDNVSDLPHLNLLDLSNNKLNEIPAELCECPKLKELILKGNKFKDRRFGKLVDQCGSKQVLDYLETILKKERASQGKKEKKITKKKRPKKDTEDVEVICDQIKVIHFSDGSGTTIQVKPAVMSVRQFIVCCVVRNLDFTKSNEFFKRFINLQTKLHDGICQKRQAATIATHDLQKLKTPLTYDAKFPGSLMIIPLFKHKEVSGESLVEKLRQEAEELRKEKKRNTVSGIHKYLDLLEGKIQYPCVVDGDGHVISFPPITNSDKTKISKDTTDILVEVTSSLSLDSCKKVMEELLTRMLEMNCGKVEQKDEGEDNNAMDALRKGKLLEVEQVKILDHEGNLRVVYPSRTDLANPSIDIIRTAE